MTETLAESLAQISVATTLPFLPGWAAAALVSALVIAVAVGAALAVHRLGLAFLIRLSQQQPYLLRIVTGTQGPSRAALVLFALAVTVPAVPVDPEFRAVLSHVFGVATIALIGWIALAAIHIAADLYLSRFRTDLTDNLLARKHVTQIQVLRRAADTLVIIITIGFALMSFEAVRQYGVSLFASAGLAGLVVGLAARPVLSNLVAGVQLAITQPVRLEDVVVVENEWGRIEEITSTYVVVRVWDLRRLIVPLTYFIEKPFQNWTHRSSAILGSVMLHLDYSAPIDAIRAEAKAIVEASPNWDRKVCAVQVTDSKEWTVEVRILVSADNAGQAWDLRCELREKIIAFLQREHPNALPRRRQESIAAPSAAPSELSPTPDRDETTREIAGQKAID